MDKSVLSNHDKRSSLEPFLFLVKYIATITKLGVTTRNSGNQYYIPLYNACIEYNYKLWREYFVLDCFSKQTTLTSQSDIQHFSVGKHRDDKNNPPCIQGKLKQCFSCLVVGELSVSP